MPTMKIINTDGCLEWLINKMPDLEQLYKEIGDTKRFFAKTTDGRSLIIGSEIIDKSIIEFIPDSKSGDRNNSGSSQP